MTGLLPAVSIQWHNPNPRGLCTKELAGSRQAHLCWVRPEQLKAAVHLQEHRYKSNWNQTIGNVFLFGIWTTENTDTAHGYWTCSKGCIFCLSVVTFLQKEQSHELIRTVNNSLVKKRNSVVFRSSCMTCGHVKRKSQLLVNLEYSRNYFLKTFLPSALFYWCRNYIFQW